MNAIGIKIKKADKNSDLGASKFFGAPVLPSQWQDMFSDDVIFFAHPSTKENFDNSFVILNILLVIVYLDKILF